VRGATLALTALVAATAAFAQTTPPPTTAEPAPSAAAQQESPDSTSSDQSARSNSANTEALMQDCLRQVQSANPGVAESDIRKFCENEIRKSTQQPEQ
jgi:hypothetical protein